MTENGASSGSGTAGVTIRVPGGRRAELATYLKERGVATQIHYPTPVHLQAAYAGAGYRRGDLPESEAWGDEELSLPLFPELTDDEQGRVIAAVRSWGLGRGV